MLISLPATWEQLWPIVLRITANQTPITGDKNAIKWLFFRICSWPIIIRSCSDFWNFAQITKTQRSKDMSGTDLWSDCFIWVAAIGFAYAIITGVVVYLGFRAGSCNRGRNDDSAII